jgi:hypothetical protein
MQQELQDQLSECFQTRDAEEALRHVVLSWKASGMSQQAVLEIFEDYRNVLRLRDKEEKEDIFMSVMDAIAGWCNSQYQLF